MKKLLGILVLSLVLSGCADDLVNEKINFTHKDKPFVNFKNDKFQKGSIGQLMKIRSLRKKCVLENKTFWGYAKCIDRLEKSYYNVYLDPAVRKSFSSVLFIHTLLNHFKISSDQEAFDNFDDFIYSANLNKPVENDLKKINQFTKCNDNNEFSTFINCLNLFFRNWQIYENSNVHEKVNMEQIIGFSLILNNQKQINADAIFNLDLQTSYKYRTQYYPHYRAFKNILSSDKTFFLKNSDDGYFFLEKLMNFYSSDEYKNLVNIDRKESLELRKKKITKYENSSLLDKLNYYWIENPNVQTGLRYAEAAITIYVAYEFLNTLSNTNFSNIDDLISSKKNGNTNTSNSSLERGTLIKPYGKGKSQSGLFMSHPDNSNVGLFQVTKPGNYMYSKWIPVFKIGFF